MTDRTGRGRCRIYLSAAPGAGKTTRLLQDAHALRARGVDVVVAWADPRGRDDVAALLRDLEAAPRRRFELRGLHVDEMDVEAVLARRPGLAIVDDLPHSNAPGSRHRKRHEDAAELLAAGVDVISAMDVAQVESLNDVVERTTGMQVRETVPDTFLRAAEDVVCLDVTVDDLAQRLRAGRIVTAEPVAEASGGALRPDRLAALRELALREAAEHVRRPPAGPLPPQVAGRLMVALSSLSPRASTLLRRGARLAGA